MLIDARMSVVARAAANE